MFLEVIFSDSKHNWSYLSRWKIWLGFNLFMKASFDIRLKARRLLMFWSKLSPCNAHRPTSQCGCTRWKRRYKHGGKNVSIIIYSQWVTPRWIHVRIHTERLYCKTEETCCVRKMITYPFNTLIHRCSSHVCLYNSELWRNSDFGLLPADNTAE